MAVKAMMGSVLLMKAMLTLVATELVSMVCST